MEARDRAVRVLEETNQTTRTSVNRALSMNENTQAKLLETQARVVEADADVQIKVAVAHGRRAREFILHLGNLQADTCEPIQDVEKFVGRLTQNSSSREIFEITSVAAVVVGELL